MNYKDIKIHFIVVLYDKLVEESDTLNSMCGIPKNLVTVWNNGPKNITSLEWDVENNLNNVPLGKIYNKILEKNIDYLVILDDDTTLPEDYYQKIKRNVERYPGIEVFIPCCMQNGKQISPIIKNGKIENAVASGLIIKKENHVLFNDKLPLYGVDTEFMYFARQNKNIRFMKEIILNHEISFSNNPFDKNRRKKLLLSQINMIKKVKLKHKAKYLLSAIKNVCVITLKK